MQLVALLLTALFLLEARRWRARLAALRTLPALPAGAAADPDVELALMEGVELDDATLRAAEAHARAEGLAVVDLVPADLPALDALELARLTDLPTYRSDRLARGRSARHVTLFRADVARRAGCKGERLRDPVAFAALAVRLKRYAAATTDLALAPRLRALPARSARAQRACRERALLRELLGDAPPLAVARPLLLGGLLVLLLALPGARLFGALALLVFQLQPALALAGGPLRPRDLWLVVLLRLPLELARGLALLFEAPQQHESEAREAARAVYAGLLADGSARFFEPRREDCPLCGSRALAPRVRCADWLQCKPGSFALERCAACGHIFQNPRLSAAGLDFYYRDFYAGLGEATLAAVFAQHGRFYRARAELVRGAVTPARWLDVGGGHGHFCAAAREVWPATRFDSVDWSEAIEEAERCGWVDRAWRGLFTELAPGFAGQYDVVSMSHYLEHTGEPRRELAAAALALAPGGCLLIELPDPEASLARLLGRWWYVWFQPQHLHLLSAGNLEALLRECGFTPLAWQRHEAGLGGDFVFAVLFALRSLSPPLALPWRPRPTWRARVWHAVVWSLGVVPLAGAALLDALVAVFARPLRSSNAYRVLARKSHAAGAAAAAPIAGAPASAGLPAGAPT